jgi:hypothetical protein
MKVAGLWPELIKRTMTANPQIISNETALWLLDRQDPGPRYLSMLYLADARPAELEEEAERAHSLGPIRTILDVFQSEGYWENDGPGYLPKYTSTVWSLVMLAQMGAKIKYDSRLDTACQRYLDRAISPNGQISINGVPSGTVDCLQGNILSALLDLGCNDSRLVSAFDWMARSLTGDGVAPMEEKNANLRYYSGKIGPDFQCGGNNKLSCAWGGTKVMLAFSKLPSSQRTPLIKKAIQRGTDFLLSSDPAVAAYPNGWNPKPSGNWWKFGFPVFYVTDILQIVEALSRLGLADDSRLDNAFKLILEKRNDDGRWPLEYDYTGKTWVGFGPKKVSNKWVSIRALYVLRHRYPSLTLAL